MITRRELLTGFAAVTTAAVAAPTLAIPDTKKALAVVEQESGKCGFGLAPVKPEGGHYWPDPAEWMRTISP